MRNLQVTLEHVTWEEVETIGRFEVVIEESEITRTGFDISLKEDGKNFNLSIPREVISHLLYGEQSSD